MVVEDIIRIMRAADGDTALIVVGWFVTGFLALAAAFVRRGIWLAAILCVVLAAGLGGTFAYARLVGAGGSPTTAAIAFDLHRDKVFIGGNLAGSMGRAEAGSVENCQGRCASDGRCLAFTFDRTTRTCELKAVVGPLHAIEGAVSGIRRVAGQALRK